MSLNWNEIKSRALKFSKDWKDVTSERAEAKTFWDEFFNVFGISRRRVATFEKPVRMPDESIGYIDLLWKGTLLVEHKSKGRNLDKAFTQAKDYFPGIEEDELPKYILVTDFDKFRLYDLDSDKKTEFYLRDLHKRVHLFDFILGFKRQVFKEEDPVNIEAANLMGLLHDQLKFNGYEGHNLERFLVRILFILFADDTGIINPKNHFEFYIIERTAIDGSDLGSHLAMIFQVLNTPPDKKQKNLDEDLNKFPYINGDLFSETLPITAFDSDMRRILLECCHFDWSKISPAIFGSLFQSVMDKEKRRDLGAHYTSEKNIMKVIKGLFLDDLYREFNECKDNPNKLEKLHNKISSLKFLDPACGCGNFLIIAYRELRLLEIEILRNLQQYKRMDVLEDRSIVEKDEYDVQMRMEAKDLSKIDVDCMYGIEIEEFPSRIAEVAMWLMDHQMNLKLSEEFGNYIVRIPLYKSPQIVNGNSLKIDWRDIIDNTTCNYILGNPPFIGKKRRTAEQNADMDYVFAGLNNYGVLDYVCSWYIKALNYIRNTKIKVAFVSTNSICQGEQVGILWEMLFRNGVKIHFAHRTFKWDNEAKGKAAVHVIILGFATFDTKNKVLFDYESLNSEPHEILVKNINPYLVNQDDILILSRNKPICNVPEISFGNMPNDDGNFLFSSEERNEIIRKSPELEKYFKPFVSAKEFLNNEQRWCLWLEEISPNEIKTNMFIEERVENVRKFRLKSNREATRKLASYPYLFGEIRQPKSDYIVIPRHSSENRKYIPISILTDDYIVADSCLFIQYANYFIFGVITSIMHNTFMRLVCGRIKSDYRYSNKLVYNNFPFPENPSEEKILKVEESVKSMLEVREEYNGNSLSDLYDPISMPKKLVDAHNKLDKAVDLCYRHQPFPNELSRLVFLFELYKKYTEPLLKIDIKKKRAQK